MPATLYMGAAAGGSRS